MADGVSFDNELFGLLLRRARKDAGFSNVEDFIEAIKRKTGYIVSKDTLYKVESGKSRITLDSLLAINITLYGRVNTYQFWNNVMTSCPKEWKDIEEKASQADYDAMLEDLQVVDGVALR